jgi:transposase
MKVTKQTQMEAIFLSNSKATFVDYNMGQLILPMDFSDLIDPHDVSRVVNEMVDIVSDDVFFFHNIKGVAAALTTRK